MNRRISSSSHFIRVGLPFLSLMALSSALLASLLRQREKTAESLNSRDSFELEETKPFNFASEYEETMKKIGDTRNFEFVRVPRPENGK